MNKRNIINILSNKIQLKDEDKNLLKEIYEAKKEWEAARSYFQIATESDMIIFAIYREKAAEYRYDYLLQQAKKVNISVPYSWMIERVD